MGKKHTSGSGTQGSLHSFVQDGVKYIPISMSNAGENDPGIMDEEEFKRMTYKMTDAELNDYLYRQAKEYVAPENAVFVRSRAFADCHYIEKLVFANVDSFYDLAAAACPVDASRGIW